MESNMRRTGIDVIGDVPWGTHFCQFYETSQDLIETLVPYFKEGLEADEFCVWVTSEPLRVDQASAALRAAVPDLDDYIDKGQIEILDYRAWYTRSGKFSADEVLQGWVDKLKAAQKRGYEGLRLSGNTFWLEKADWDDFTRYEENVNSVIGRYPMLAICTYSLQKYNSVEILDVVANHQFALIKGSGRWRIIESTQHKKMEQALRESEERYSKLFETMTEGFSYDEIICDDTGKPCDLRYLEVNPAFERQTGLKAADILGRTTLELFPRAEPLWFERYGKVALTGEAVHFESWFGPLGRCFEVSAFQTEPGRFGVVFSDVTERKLSEEALASERANLQAIFDVINVGMLLIDENGIVKRINNAVFQRFGEKNLLSKCGGQPGDVLGCIHAVNDPLGCGHTLHCTSCPIRNAFETVLRSGQSVNNIETEAALLIGGNEICLWLAVSADPLVLDGKKHAILAINDITERKQAMKDIESLAKFPEENPNSVMRIATDGTIVYANPSSALLMKAWGCQVGEMLPDAYRKLIQEALRSGNRNEIEATTGGTIYSIVFAPIVDMGYVNIYGRDVTQHKLADKALKESEQRFRDAIDHFPNVFVIYDADRRVTYVNSNGLQIMGLSEQEVIGRRDEEIFPPEMINSYLPALKHAVETKMPQALERTRPASMGGQTIIANIIPLLDESGEVRQILGITHDITERKRQEEQITKLTRLYSVLSRVNEAIVRVGEEDSLYSEICRIVAEVGGYPLVWIGKVKERLVMPVAWSGPASDYLLDIRVEVQGELGKGPTGTCIRENRSVINDDFATNPTTSPWREPAQSYGFRASAAFPLQRQGNVIGAFTLYASEPKAFDNEQVGLLESLSADISYALDALDKEQLRVLAEEGLRETRDYLENLIDYANAPIIVWDPSFKITRFNHAFERLTGLRAAEALGEQLDTLFPEESRDTSLQYISRTLSGERWEVVEIPIKKIDGSVRTVLWNSANIYDKDGTTVVATIAQGQDITERKLAEEGLRKSRDELEQRVQERTAKLSNASEELAARAQELAKKTEDLTRSNSELEQFAYVASHDLQEPLRMISSYVQLLSRRYEGKLDKDADDFIAYAVEGTKRMQQLINDLLAYSRVGTRGKPPAPTDFEDVFSEAMANLKMATEEAGAVVTHDQLPTAMADKLQMVQLFQNLIGNAIKFSGKEIPQVHVSARPDEGKWVFSVRDNGIGIDPQFHDRIFTIFQRLHGRDEYPGTGIGLAVSKKIVERHGGRIWLESSLGKGTTFYFTVPLQAEQAEIEPTNYAEQNEGR